MLFLNHQYSQLPFLHKTELLKDELVVVMIDHLTFNDANVAIQLFKFIIRKPNMISKKFEFKCFDEVMISSMGLFYPEIFLERADDDDDNNNNNNSILFGKTLPIKKVHKEGIFENKSGKFEGYDNKDRSIIFVEILVEIFRIDII